MQCNIDAKGKAVRLLIGSAFIVLGLIGLALAWAGVISGTFAWGVSIGLVLAGIFGVIEGAAGWCAVRAMGFRTRI